MIYMSHGEKNKMPECPLTFLSVLYNVPKHKLFHTSAKDLEQEGWIADNKNISLHCLFRMMYYGLYTGTKKTPMHMIFGHSLYARDRSKTLMTGFNRVIVCA